MYPVDLLNRRFKSFVLWAPDPKPPFTKPPELVLGLLSSEEPSSFREVSRIPLIESPDQPDLWQLDLSSIRTVLQDDAVYHYWFSIEDSSPERRGTVCVTDPLAFTVDYRATRDDDLRQPASVVKYSKGQLYACDVDGVEPIYPSAPDQTTMPESNHLVIYELPTLWAKGSDRGTELHIATYDDVSALLNLHSVGDRFTSVSAVCYEAILAGLGINALLLPPLANAKPTSRRGPAAAHFFAPDNDLGTTLALTCLVTILNSRGIRFFTDVAMASGNDPYRYVDFQQFHLRPDREPSNPDSYQSSAHHTLRNDHRGESWRYIQKTVTYDPESGDIGLVRPSWAFHRAHLARWMVDLVPSGICINDVKDIGNWDFIRSYKERAWELYDRRYPNNGDPAKFLVVGKGVDLPVSIVRRGVVNAVWNEAWQVRLRAAILGEAAGGDSFEQTVRKIVDSRLDRPDGEEGFTDGAQAINYITSHDMDGFRRERLYDFLVMSGVKDVCRRAKVAFALLLTSVGIPMIFAGEEFADKMDHSVGSGKGKTDPVNYSRKNDGEWREILFKYVANLVGVRTTCPALGENYTDFFHVDQSRGGRIMAWQRGVSGQGGVSVVVLANLSDEDTPGVEYMVPNWPERESPGWMEITQRREVPIQWVGREPLHHWEVKIYTRWRGVWTPQQVLHKAVRDDNIASLRQLVKNGAEVNERDPAGKTALSIALELGRLRIAQELIKCGADTCIKWDGSVRMLLQQIRDEWTQLSEDDTQGDTLIMLGMIVARMQAEYAQPLSLGQPAPQKTYLRSQWQVPKVLRSIDSDREAGLTFLESWQKIRDMLSRYIALTGDDGAFECSPCKEFLKKSWGVDGLIALNTVSFGAARLSTFEPPVPSLEEGNDQWRDSRLLPIVHVTGEYILISLTQLSLSRQESIVEAMNWICCSIRPAPKLSTQERNRVFYSSRRLGPYQSAVGDVRLVAQSLKALLPMTQDNFEPHACWTRLFRIVIVSWYQWGQRRWGTGLELSYALLRHLAVADISCTLSEEHGELSGQKGRDRDEERSGTTNETKNGAHAEVFVLLGFFTALIPIRWEKPGGNLNIQWHLEAQELNEGILDPRALDLDWHRIRNGDFRQLGQKLEKYDLEYQENDQPRCFLGWCDDAHVLLGTRELGGLNNLLGSTLEIRKRTLHITGGKLGGTVGASGGPMAPANIAINPVVEFTFQNNVQYYERLTSFDQALLLSRKEVAFLYDNSSKQAWLVPKLSLMLHLCHSLFRAFPDASEAAEDPIPFAKPEPDGASATIRALTSKGDISVLGQPGSSSALTLAAIFLILNTNLYNTAKTREQPRRSMLRKTKIYVSELMDMIIQPPRGSALREITPQTAAVAWKCLSEQVDVSLAGSGIGCAISPAPPSGGNTHCRCAKVPVNKDYIVAHMRCLNELAVRNGKTIKDSESGICQLAAGAFWHLRGWRQSCPECGHAIWDSCILQQIKKKPKKKIGPPVWHRGETAAS